MIQPVESTRSTRHQLSSRLIPALLATFILAASVTTFLVGRWSREYDLAFTSLRQVLRYTVGDAYMRQDQDLLDVIQVNLLQNQGIALSMVDSSGHDMLTRQPLKPEFLGQFKHRDPILYADPQGSTQQVGWLYSDKRFDPLKAAYPLIVGVFLVLLGSWYLFYSRVKALLVSPLEAIKEDLTVYSERNFEAFHLQPLKNTTLEIENLRETLVRLDERLQDNNRRIQEATEKEARSVALRDIYHGIRGMILKVSGPASSLQKWLDRRPDLPADDRLRIEAQIRLLGQVADHIRAYTDRIQASMSDSPDADLPVDLAVVRVQDLVARLDADYAIVCDGDDHHWTVNQPAEPVAIRADRLVLFNQLDSLLRNAVSALSARRPEGGGHLALEVVRQDGQVQFSITDDGPGLDDVTVRAFHREQRIPSRKGWGVGLTFARRYIRLMGGTIEHRVPEGGGTRFVIRFEEVPLA